MVQWLSCLLHHLSFWFSVMDTINYLPRSGGKTDCIARWFLKWHYLILVTLTQGLVISLARSGSQYCHSQIDRIQDADSIKLHHKRFHHSPKKSIKITCKYSIKFLLIRILSSLAFSTSLFSMVKYVEKKHIFSVANETSLPQIHSLYIMITQ